ncbi:hypothetical protein DMA11_10265 [Marinilabiliaceae bacterium JC017]|nr:hypothetical protein DMA11_10265 [Marinilabiliaceae bacterium JC017]
MKRTFANYFKITPASNVTSISGDNIMLDPAQELDLILTENNLELKEEQKEAGANDYFFQSCRAVALPVTPEIREKYRNTRVVVQYNTTRGEIFTWGTREIPVRVKLDSKLDGDEFLFTRKSPTPIYI